MKDEKQDLVHCELFGLSEAEARRRLAIDGPNALPRQESRRLNKIVKEIVSEPMVFLLVGCGVIYLVLGDRQEAVMLLGFLSIILGITFYQEQKTERVLEALRDLSSPRALVLRDGEKKRISGAEVVRGDIFFITEGDRVPSDGLILSCQNPTINESMLTGESVPVSKVRSPAAKDRAYALDSRWRESPSDVSRTSVARRDVLVSARNQESMVDTGTTALSGSPVSARNQESMVYAGTTVLSGSIVAEATQTGNLTELGKIGKIVQHAVSGQTGLQLETKRLVKFVAILAILLCLTVVIAYA
jgi:Ca2+-transporting ATPase